MCKILNSCQRGRLVLKFKTGGWLFLQIRVFSWLFLKSTLNIIILEVSLIEGLANVKGNLALYEPRILELLDMKVLTLAIVLS